MPGVCAVRGCNNTSKGKNVSFYTIPPIKHNEGCEIEDLTKERQRLWILAIDRSDIKVGTIKGHHKVCSDHFMSGRPAYYRMDTDPDWIPNQCLDTNTNKSDGRKVPVTRKRSRNKGSTSKAIPPESKNNENCFVQEQGTNNSVKDVSWNFTSVASGSESERNDRVTNMMQTQGTNTSLKEESSSCEYDTHGYDRMSSQMQTHRTNFTTARKEPPPKTRHRTNDPSQTQPMYIDLSEMGTQTDLTMQAISRLEKTSQALNDMTCELVSLRKKVTVDCFNEEMFKDSDDNVKYYTGLTSFAILINLVNLVSPALTHTKNTLTKFQEIVLVLIKIRLGLHNRLLGHMFSIDTSTVSRAFLRVLKGMYYSMKFLILWPEKEAFKKIMPSKFAKSFPHRAVVIVDCFEVCIDEPFNMKARAQAPSNERSSNVMKYLIGITSQGSVCFVSDGYGIGTTDKIIIESSSFLSHLEMGDTVLANRGFDCQEGIGLMCAELSMSPEGEKQLCPYNYEATKKIAHLRTHVDRIVSNVRQKSSILSTKVPIEYIKPSSSDGISTLDQIVCVSACIVNLCPPVPAMTVA